MEKIKFKTCCSGDWQILEYKDFRVSNHSISYIDWIDLLKYLGYEIEMIELSDDKMELEG